MTETRIKVTDHRHVWAMGSVSGLMTAIELLEALPATVKGTPGIVLAIATIAAESNRERGAYVAKNLIAIAKAGHPIEHYKSVHYDPNRSELVCEFYEPDLFDADAIE